MVPLYVEKGTNYQFRMKLIKYNKNENDIVLRADSTMKKRMIK